MFELFHRIADPGSAKARRFIVDYALHERVRFRNLHYEEVERDWAARGGTETPALWDGERLFQGTDAVISKLQQLTDLGRAP